MKHILQIFFGIILIFGFCGCGLNERIVGKNIQKDDINEFYYTMSTSTFPPMYQRYQIYLEEGKVYLFHETREGNDFPLTEKHTTLKGTIALNKDEWSFLYECLEGGTVVKRKDSANAGGSSPYLYLCWKKDRGKIQEFTFLNEEKEETFVQYCEKLIERSQS